MKPPTMTSVAVEVRGGRVQDGKIRILPQRARTTVSLPSIQQ
jgi:hypothetical protein